MRVQLEHVSKRIRSDLDELQEVLQRIKEGWNRAKRSGDDYYLDGVALNLHGLYSGLERIFEVIGDKVDGTLPKGENWHRGISLKKRNENAALITLNLTL